MVGDEGETETETTSDEDTESIETGVHAEEGDIAENARDSDEEVDGEADEEPDSFGIEFCEQI